MNEGRALQVTTGPCRSCAGRQGPAVTLLDGHLFHMTDGRALRCETPAWDARDCRPVGTYRAPGTLGITVCGTVLVTLKDIAGYKVIRRHQWVATVESC